MFRNSEKEESKTISKRKYLSLMDVRDIRTTGGRIMSIFMYVTKENIFHQFYNQETNKLQYPPKEKRLKSWNG
jgi:hypothetical protein